MFLLFEQVDHTGGPFIPGRGQPKLWRVLQEREFERSGSRGHFDPMPACSPPQAAI